jgi:hypothetical protein
MDIDQTALKAVKVFTNFPTFQSRCERLQKFSVFVFDGCEVASLPLSTYGSEWISVTQNWSSLLVDSRHSAWKVPSTMDKIVLKQSQRYQNTYRLESKNPFNHDLVKIILQRIMDKHFKQVEQIDSKTTAVLCRNVSDDVIEKVKMCSFDR